MPVIFLRCPMLPWLPGCHGGLQANLALLHKPGSSSPPERGVLTLSASQNIYSCHCKDLTCGLRADKCFAMWSPARALGDRTDRRGSLGTSCFEGWSWNRNFGGEHDFSTPVQKNQAHKKENKKKQEKVRFKPFNIWDNNICESMCQWSIL